MNNLVARLRAVAENQSRVTGGVVRVDTNVFSQAADEIERLEARNARLLAALSPFANKRTCECMQFIGKHLVFGAGKKCDYCNAAEMACARYAPIGTTACRVLVTEPPKRRKK